VSRGDALCGFYFEGETHAPTVQSGWKYDPENALFAETERQLGEIIAGKRQEFDLPLCSEGTAFQKAVWEVIRSIPFGKTITYSELAVAVGRPKAVRAVGAATGRNPISWIVPCHRVMGARGAITGYAGGVARKEALLRFEQCGVA